MQTVRALPVHDGTNKALREGFVSHKFDEKQRHPVAVIQENVQKFEWDRRLQTAERLFGAHAPLRLNMERAILSQAQRLPGLRSERVGLHVALAAEGEFGFENYLGDPFEDPEAPLLSVHDVMEKQLGM